jgi:hypothetical protein
MVSCNMNSLWPRWGGFQFSIEVECLLHDNARWNGNQLPHTVLLTPLHAPTLQRLRPMTVEVVGGVVNRGG